MNEVLSRVRQIFQDSQLSQAQIARKISATPQYVWKILNDETTNPRKQTLHIISEAFGVNESWLLDGKGAQYKPLVELSNTISSLNDEDATFIKDMLQIYEGLDDVSRQALRTIADKMAEKYR